MLFALYFHPKNKMSRSMFCVTLAKSDNNTNHRWGNNQKRINEGHWRVVETRAINCGNNNRVFFFGLLYIQFVI